MVNLYVLLGKETHLKKEFVQSLKKKFFPTGDASLNYQEFDSEHDKIFTVLDFIQTAPFLSEKRMAVLWGIDDLEEEEQTAILDVKKNWPATAVLVVSSEASNVKKSEFLTQLGQNANVSVYHVPFDKDMPQWLVNRAVKKEMTLDSAAVSMILDRVGRDIAGLDSSLEALKLFVHPRKQITAADVEALLGRSVQEDVFALMDDLLDKNAAAALKRVEDLFREGAKSFELVSILAGQLERLSKVMSGAPDLKIHAFVLEKIQKQCRKVTKEKLVWITRQVLACDEALKTSQMDDRVCLEGMILSICESRVFRPALNS